MSRTQRTSRHRVIGVVVLATAVVAVMADAGPVQAATIPTTPAVCNPALSPGNPVITSLTRTPSSVNVTSSHKNVTFTIKAKDSTKDISSVFVELLSKSVGDLQESAASAGNGHLVSGTPRNGTWKLTVPIDRWMLDGTWTTDVTLSDAGGAYVSYSAHGGGDKPWNSAWPKTVHVTSTPDVKPPTVSALTLSTTSVDTTGAPKKIKVSLRAKDALSGVDGPITVSAYRDVGDIEYFAQVDLHRTSGGRRDGIYEGSLTIPRWVGNGTHTWRFSIDHAFDRIGNTLTLDSPALKAKHLPSTFTVTSHGDSTKPVLTATTLTPTSVDARTHDKSVTVTVKAHDTQSGVESGFAQLEGPSGDFTSIDLHKVGVSSPGSWTGALLIPRCSEPGTWKLSVGLFDHAHNFSMYSASQIKAAHLPDTVSVQALDITQPDVRVASHQPQAGPVLVTFTEPTLFKGSVNPLQVYDTTTYVMVPGTWTCKNTLAVVVGCNADGANVLTASFAPTAALTLGRKYEVKASHGIYDTSGNGPAYVDKFFITT